MGDTRRHCGHCRSSKTTMATCAPLGGRNAGFNGSFAAAHKPAANTNANNDRTAYQLRDPFFITRLIIARLIMARSAFMVTEAASWCQVTRRDSPLRLHSGLLVRNPSRRRAIVES